MTIFYSADLHLGHQRIIELCDRPFDSVEEMNRTIIERCNDTVREGDSLYLLGDLVMGSYAENVELLRQIRCRHVTLIPGNHDRWSLAYHHRNPALRDSYAAQLREMGFTVYPDGEPSVWGHVTNGGNPVYLSHYPFSGDSHDEDRYVDLRPDPELEKAPLLHGHVHEKWQTHGRMLNVGVDVWDFRPVSSMVVDDWLDSLD